MAIRNLVHGRFLRNSSVTGARFMSSWFRSIEPAPKDPILGVTEAFLADQSPNKVNVGVVSSPSPFSLRFRSDFLGKWIKTQIDWEKRVNWSNHPSITVYCSLSLSPSLSGGIKLHWCIYIKWIPFIFLFRILIHACTSLANRKKNLDQIFENLFTWRHRNRVFVILLTFIYLFFSGSLCNLI